DLGITSNLWSIEYRDTNEVWISGLDNVLFKSIDNGTTWQTVLTGYTRTNWEIDYWNKELGVIACDSGKVLITKNGGDTWTEIQTQTPETQGIYAIKFLGPNKVVMGTETGALYFSEDTGSTWKKSEQVKLGTPIEDIAFADSLNGFGVVSNHIFHQVTTDGGRTWQIKYPLMGNQFAYFIDANYGYNIGYNMEFWKTSDGGKKWSKVIVNDKLTDIQFLENGEVLVGSNENLLSTDDKFTAFERDSSLGPTPYIYFIDKNIGFAFCDFATSSRLYRTSDMGNMWKIVDSNLFFLDKIKFVNKDVGFYLDAHGLKKTTDGGYTWNTLFSLSQRAHFVFSFANDSIGWFAQDTLYTTTDGGINWYKGTTDFEGNYLWDMEFTSEKQGWVVSTSNVNFYTSDG
ncbi:MAG: YCF48-related protein, partial [Leadbetterella sp.]|nr:YCF48-related protein [Leadbetterella sp.]